MISHPRTLEGKVVLHERTTGEQIERWPVDAIGMLAHGGWSLTPPDAAPVLELPAPEPLDPAHLAAFKVVTNAEAGPTVAFAFPKGRTKATKRAE